MTASLFADSETNRLNNELTISTDTSIGHNRFTKNSVVSINSVPANTTQIGFDENAVGQNSMLHFRSPQISSAEITPVKGRFHNTGIFQVGSIENSSLNGGFREFRSSQVNVNEESLRNRRTKEKFFQVGSSHINTFEFSPAKISMGEISSTEISTIKVISLELSLSEISSTQVRSTQISPYQLNVSEVSFPSSVKSEQFFSTEFFHNLIPQVINQLNHSATQLWSEVLQSKSPPEITLQITDLPTGQLAEAQLTQFNASGQSSAGTLTNNVG